ncbi:PfkB family carbohydrate kinase [uncultured Nocardioides sp.]|uniref:PfkB family carbohydrate kinase n=1 Tax=uncultured Nocardioides sp. TaxID=198441 RepID=UPI0026180814|nr:PfkB family carbohydrate kinase [uncultured Nocardioides sp.]
MEPDVLVVGEALVDVVHAGDGSVSERAGGSAANVAVALARLGRPVRFATAFAEDEYGAVLADHLSAAGVDLASDPHVVGRTSSAVATIGSDGAASYEFDVDWQLGEVPVQPAPMAVHVCSLGAVLAPTDPVLAGDVQVGPPLEGNEHPVRFALTTEAAINDGLAFPFVYLGLAVAAQGTLFGDWGPQWLAQDVAWRIAAGVAMGTAGGWALGQVLFVLPRGATLADTASGVVALAGVLLCYGSTELVEGYGFIAVAVMGLTLRRIEAEHEFHRRLHNFTQALEHALTAVLLVALGAVLPALLQGLSWTDAGIALALILLVRPIAGWLSLIGTDVRGRDRWVVAIYGVRGIGSIYYLAYAAGKIEFLNEDRLWALVGFTILISTLLHGFTSAMAIEDLSQEAEGPEA